MKMKTKLIILLAMLFMMLYAFPTREDRLRDIMMESLKQEDELNLDLDFAKGTSKDVTFNFYVEKMAMTARVVTAITLRIGLSDGSIPVDATIEELLGINSGGLKTLENFDQKAVEGYLTKLETAPGKLKTKSADLERELIQMSKIRRGAKSKSLITKVPADAEKKLEVFKTWNPTSLKDFPIDVMIGHANDKNTKSFETELDKLKTNVNNAEKELGDVKAVFGALDSILALQNFFDLSTLYEQGKGFFTIKKKRDQPHMIDNFKVLNDLSSGDDAGFRTIDSILSSRLMSKAIDRRFTSGFPKGYKDIEKLSSDIDDEFIKNLNPASPLNDTLKLKHIVGGMAKLDNEWITVATNENFKAVKTIATMRSNSKSVSTITKDIDKIVTSMGDCSSSLDTTYLGNLKIVLDIANEWRKSIDAVKSLKTILTSTQFDKPVSLADLSQPSGPLSGLKLELALVKDGIASHGTFVEKLGILHTSGSEIAAMTKSIECVRDKKDGLDKLVMGLTLLDQLRTIQTTTVREVIGSISKSASSFKDIRKAAKSMNADKPKDLEVYKKLAPESEPFGESVQAIRAISEVLDKSTSLKLYLSDGQRLEKDVTDSKTNYMVTFKQNWGDFDKTAKEVKDLLSDAQGKAGKFKPSDPKNLSSFASSFKGMSGLKDVDLQTEKRLKAAELFEGQTSDPSHKSDIDKFKKSLEDVAHLDLHFSRFSSPLSKIDGVLDRISKAFVKEKEKPEEQTAPPPTQPKYPHPYGDPTTTIAIFSCIALLLLYFAVHFAWKWWKAEWGIGKCRRKRIYNMNTALEPGQKKPKHKKPKPKNPNHEEQDDLPDDISNIPRITPALDPEFRNKPLKKPKSKPKSKPKGTATTTASATTSTSDPLGTVKTTTSKIESAKPSEKPPPPPPPPPPPAAPAKEKKDSKMKAAPAPDKGKEKDKESKMKKPAEGKDAKGKEAAAKSLATKSGETEKNKTLEADPSAQESTKWLTVSGKRTRFT